MKKDLAELSIFKARGSRNYVEVVRASFGEDQTVNW
jgi:hypothetical protein